MAQVTLAIDISNFDVPFDASTVAAMKAAGVEGVIIGCQRQPIAEQQATVCRDNGMPILGTYCFLYWGNSVGPEVAKAVAVAKLFGVSRVWIDCENSSDAAPYATPSSRIADVQSAVDAVHAAGLEPGIYTYQPFWEGAMRNTTQFSSLPLWHASYWDDGHAQETVDYGGWTQLAMHQYTSAFDVGGRKRDANYVFEGGDVMADPIVEAILRALTGRDGADAAARLAAWNTKDGAQSGNSLLDGYEGYQQRVGALEASGGAAGHELVDGDTVTITRVKGK